MLPILTLIISFVIFLFNIYSLIFASLFTYEQDIMIIKTACRNAFIIK